LRENGVREGRRMIGKGMGVARRVRVTGVKERLELKNEVRELIFM
jgi:hypothetical protein